MSGSERKDSPPAAVTGNPGAPTTRDADVLVTPEPR